MKEIVLVVFIFLGVIAFLIKFMVSKRNEKNLLYKSEHLPPTKDILNVVVQVWDVIKDSTHPSSRIVIECNEGLCTGHWESVK